MAAVNKLKKGQTVYAVGRNILGEIAYSWPVKILGIDLSSQTVFASWNNKAPKWYSRQIVARWRVGRVVDGK